MATLPDNLLRQIDYHDLRSMSVETKMRLATKKLEAMVRAWWYRKSISWLALGPSSFVVGALNTRESAKRLIRELPVPVRGATVPEAALSWSSAWLMPTDTLDYFLCQQWSKINENVHAGPLRELIVELTARMNEMQVIGDNGQVEESWRPDCSWTCIIIDDYAEDREGDGERIVDWVRDELWDRVASSAERTLKWLYKWPSPVTKLEALAMWRVVTATLDLHFDATWDSSQKRLLVYRVRTAPELIYIASEPGQRSHWIVDRGAQGATAWSTRNTS